MKVTFISLLLPLFLLDACSSRGQDINKDALSFKKFPQEVKIELLEPVLHEKLPMIDSFVLYQDSLAFCKIPNSSYHLKVIDLKNKLDLGGFIPSGRKPGQVLGFISFGLSKDDAWFYDILKDELFVTPVRSMLAGENEYKAYKIPNFYYSAQMLNDSTFLGSGDYGSNYWLAAIDLKTDAVNEAFIPYLPSSSNQELSKIEKTAYESFLYLKPSGEKCILASRYADRIQVIDLESRNSKIIMGPKVFEPDMVIMMDYDEQEMSARGGDTRLTFVQGTTTNNYIYLLYSGNQHQGIHHNFGKIIYVYDWDGNPIKKIELPEYVVSIAVTSDERTLYAYSVKDKEIKIGWLQ